MKPFKIEPLNLETDKPIFASWDEQFSGTPEYAGIEKYVFENHLIYDFDELILTNYEIFPIGDDEKLNPMVAKTADGEIFAFILTHEFDLNTKSPESILHYLVLKPTHQKQGYGPEILREIYTNPKKYLGTIPKTISLKIIPGNEPCMKMVKKLGFDVRLVEEGHTSVYFCECDYKTLASNLSQNQPS